MKTVLLLILSAIAVSSYSQDLPLKDGKVFYEEVDSATGTKAELYQKAKLWFANAFKDSKSVIQVDDKENGQIVGKGNFDATYTFSLTVVPAWCNFTVKVDLKDNKYRIQLYNFDIGNSMGGAVELEYYNKNPTRNPNRKILATVRVKTEATLQGFKKALDAQADTF